MAQHEGYNFTVKVAGTTAPADDTGESLDLLDPDASMKAIGAKPKYVDGTNALSQGWAADQALIEDLASSMQKKVTETGNFAGVVGPSSAFKTTSDLFHWLKEEAFHALADTGPLKPSHLKGLAEAVAVQPVPIAPPYPPGGPTSSPADDIKEMAESLKTLPPNAEPTKVYVPGHYDGQITFKPLTSVKVGYDGVGTSEACSEFQRKWQEMMTGPNTPNVVASPPVTVHQMGELPPVFLITITVPKATTMKALKKIEESCKYIDQWMENHDVQTMTMVMQEGFEVTAQHLTAAGHGPLMQQLVENALHNYLHQHKLALVPHHLLKKLEDL